MHVHALHTYPIKSCSGLTHHRLPLGERGPEHDRMFMLVDDHGQFVTQRKHSVMAHIHVEVIGEQLHCWFQDKSLVVDFSELQDNVFPVQIWKDKVDVLAFSENTNAWFSAILGMPVHLVVQSKHGMRLIDSNYDDRDQTVSFADGFPVLITTMASLRFLNQHLGSAIDMQRFRPNIVIDGVDQAFIEDSWKKLLINGIEFDVVKPCTRCVIPSIALNSLEKQTAITKVLKQYRKTTEGIVFGQNAIHRGHGEVRVGDEVRVLE